MFCMPLSFGVRSTGAGAYEEELSVTAFRRGPVTPPTRDSTIPDSQEESEKRRLKKIYVFFQVLFSVNVSNKVLSGCRDAAQP